MTARILHNTFILAALCLVVMVNVNAQSQPNEVKKAPIPMTTASSGTEMFTSYCAPCHGKDGKGIGPVATSLKNPPANLTQLAKKNNGKFPAEHVASVLRNGVSGTHGSSDMPVWGPLFSQVSGGNSTVVQMRISNLVHYLESIQEK